MYDDVPSHPPSEPRDRPDFQVNFLHPAEPVRLQPPRRKRWSCLLVIALILGGALIWRWTATRSAPPTPADYDPVTLEPKTPDGFFRRLSQFVFPWVSPLSGIREDRINVLLLGIGGEGHDGPQLTDTIIIASIKPSTKQLAMISIPRDLEVMIPGYGKTKINFANAFGEKQTPGNGARVTVDVLAKTLNVPIHYVVRVDFHGFEEIIDTVGGVTIDVERSFTDSEYPAPKNLFQTVSFTKGVQTMDGKTALIYARSRHGNNGEGSDFARARRQQRVLLALKEKIFSFETLTSPMRIQQIMTTLKTHLMTTLSFTEIIEMVKLGRDLDHANIRTLVLDDSPNGFLIPATGTEGAFLLRPKTGNFSAIQDAINNIFSSEVTVAPPVHTPPQREPELTPVTVGDTTVIEIQNGTWRAGLAARIKKRLNDKEFSNITIGNSNVRPVAESSIYLLSSPQDSNIAVAIQKELQIPLKQTIPLSVTHATSTDILIILGEDIQE